MAKYWSQLVRSAGLAMRPVGRETGTNPFVILFVPRTGSNLLAALLDAHPQIICHHELFLPDSPPHRSLSAREGSIDIDLGSAEERDRDPFAFLGRVYKQSLGNKAVGFKMVLADPNIGILIGMLLNRDIRKIVVRRDNWLQVYTSALIAEQTHAFSRTREDAASSGVDTESVKVHVEVDRFVRYVRKRRYAYAALRWIARLTGQRFFDMEYGEIKRPEQLHSLAEFLGVNPEFEPRERIVKQNPSQLEDRIANYQEVEDSLRGTRYDVYLDGATAANR